MTKVTKSNIKKIAEKVKSYVEENKKLPSTVTVDNVKYDWAQVWYILSWAVNNLNKDLTSIPSVKACSKASGDTINEKIYPSDYKDQSKRIVQYIKQNGQAPNYVTSVKSKKKIRPRLSIYANARIIVWYYNHKILPGYCTYDSSKFKSSSSSSVVKKVVDTIKKYGRSTKTGCDNRGQNTGYNCGPHMAQEIIRNLTGVVVPQSKIAAVMGTTTSGTGHSGIDTFFAWFNKNYNYTLKWEWKNFSELGWNGLKKILESKNQDAGEHECYRDIWGHYTNYDKIYDNTVDVHNSLGSICSGTCYCGYTENRTKSTAKRYLDGISQKSILVVTRVK